MEGVGGVVSVTDGHAWCDETVNEHIQWLISKYPGCRCDIASMVYQFSWRPNIWSQMYAPAAENLEYIKTVARENDFYEFIKLRHQILSAAWADEDCKWTLRVKNLQSGVEFDDVVDFFLEFHGPVRYLRLTACEGVLH